MEKKWCSSSKIVSHCSGQKSHMDTRLDMLTFSTWRLGDILNCAWAFKLVRSMLCGVVTVLHLYPQRNWFGGNVWQPLMHFSKHHFPSSQNTVIYAHHSLPASAPNNVLEKKNKWTLASKIWSIYFYIITWFLSIDCPKDNITTRGYM